MLDINSMTSKSIDPQAAANVAMNTMREAAIAIIIANTADSRRTTPEEVENLLMPMADKFCCSTTLLRVRRNKVTKKDEVKEYYFTTNAIEDIATMARLVADIGDAWVTDTLNYSHNSEPYEGFCYKNKDGEFCAILYKESSCSLTTDYCYPCKK